MMAPFYASNEIVFVLVMSVYLLSSFAGIVAFAMALSYRLKAHYVLPGLLLALASTVFFGFLSDAVRIRYFDTDPNSFSWSLSFLPLWSVLLLAVFLVLGMSLILYFIIRKRRHSLTAMSVKEAINSLSLGLCFYDEAGRVLLLNERMSEECEELFHSPLYDGLSFWEEITKLAGENGYLEEKEERSVVLELPKGRAVCFRRIPHDFSGKKVYEVLCADVSEELALKRELERKNEELRTMGKRLRKYGENVSEVTREREILLARTKVHSNLGSLLLRTKKALLAKKGDYDSLLSEWQGITSLVFASDETVDKFEEAYKTANDIGVSIHYEGKRPPRGSKAERIFAEALLECAINAARHADGDTLKAKETEGAREYTLSIRTNGKLPPKKIKEGGGLSSLRIMAENSGGSMIVSTFEGFSLLLTMPKEESRGN